MMEHLDGLTHWLYAVKGLATEQLTAVVSHISDCMDCSSSQLEMRELDAGLRELALATAWVPGMPAEEFEDTDPFRRRPQLAELP